MKCILCGKGVLKKGHVCSDCVKEIEEMNVKKDASS